MFSFSENEGSHLHVLAAPAATLRAALAGLRVLLLLAATDTGRPAAALLSTLAASWSPSTFGFADSRYSDALPNGTISRLSSCGLTRRISYSGRT